MFNHSTAARPRAARHPFRHDLRALLGDDALTEVVEEVARQVPRLEQLFRHHEVEHLGSVNPSGDDQLSADVQANVLLQRALARSGVVARVRSEEDLEVVCLPASRPLFSAHLDPLDGSANLGRNWPVGSIVALFAGTDEVPRGDRLRLTMLISFGLRTEVVLAARERGAHLFVHRPGQGLVPRGRLRVRDGLDVAMLATTEGTTPGQRQYVSSARKARYSGCLVADVLHLLHHEQGSLWAHPRAKLRLLYEALPVALLMREAGGLALCPLPGGPAAPEELPTDDPEARYPFVFGSAEAVRRFVDLGQAPSRPPIAPRRPAGVPVLGELERWLEQECPATALPGDGDAEPAPGVYHAEDALGNSLLRIRDAGLPTYDVVRCQGLLDPGNRTLAGHLAGGRRVVVVVDAGFDENQGPALRGYLEANCPNVVEVHVLPRRANNEENKAEGRWLALHNALLRHDLDERDLVVGVGGGVVSDLVGFTAGTFRRGVPYLSVPTTLTAMIDAAISPKTAINVSGHKNSCGTFHPPRAVLSDPALLRTDPALLTGLAELIKLAAVRSAPLFDVLEREAAALVALRFQSPAGRRLVEVAQELYLGMKFDARSYRHRSASLRAFGHRFSRGLESRSGFLLTHGEAIAAEMAVAATLACHLAGLPEQERGRLIDLLDAFGLLPYCPECTVEQVWPVFAERAEAGEDLAYPIPGPHLGAGTFLSHFGREQLAAAIDAVPALRQRQPLHGRARFPAVWKGAAVELLFDFQGEEYSAMENDPHGVRAVPLSRREISPRMLTHAYRVRRRELAEGPCFVE